MTEISFKNDIRAFTLDVKGHAGYDEPGRDIVCAGISTLTSELLLAGIKANRKGTIRKFEYRAEEGDIHISWKYTNLSFLYDTVEIVMECLQHIAEQYPENVKLVQK